LPAPRGRGPVLPRIRMGNCRAWVRAVTLSAVEYRVEPQHFCGMRRGARLCVVSRQEQRDRVAKVV
jgi:hypothetical protein